MKDQMTVEKESQVPDPEMKNAKTCHEEIELLVALVTILGLLCLLVCLKTIPSVKNQRRVKNNKNQDIV